MSDPLAPLSLDPEAVRRAADVVLSDRAYRTGGDNVIARLRSWMLERLADAVDALAGVDGASALGWVVLGLVVLAAVVATLRWGRSVQRSGAVMSTSSVSHTLDADGWDRQARQLIDSGMLRAGAGARHRAFVARAVIAGVVHDEAPGWTAGEVAQRVASARPDLEASVSAATASLQRILYAQEEPDLASVQALGESLAVIEVRLSAVGVR